MQEEPASSLPICPSNTRPFSSRHPSPPPLPCSSVQTLGLRSLSAPWLLPCPPRFFPFCRPGMPLQPQRHRLCQSPPSYHPRVFQLHQFGLRQLRPPMAKPPPNLQCRDPHHRIHMFSATHKEEIQSIVKQLFREYTSYSAEDQEGKRVAVDLNFKFTELAFNVIVETITGKQFHGEKMMDGEDGRKFREVIPEGSLLLEVSGILDAFQVLGWRDLTGVNRRMVNARREGCELVQRLIDNHQKRSEAGEGGGGFLFLCFFFY